MDIKRAKQEIKDSIEAYLAKDEFGEYLIPAIRQRPILLMGAPGIGKTQIMEQIARECKVGLVSYTITHHTRQSAVGLPFIKEKTFGQETFSVTEYTMSEIIASVYEKMEKTGLREGILFIDSEKGIIRLKLFVMGENGWGFAHKLKTVCPIITGNLIGNNKITLVDNMVINRHEYLGAYTEVIVQVTWAFWGIHYLLKTPSEKRLISFVPSYNIY